MLRFLGISTLVLLAAVAAPAAPPEALSVLSLAAKDAGGSLRAGFAASADPAERDLRTASVTIQVGGAAPESFARGTRGFKVKRRGTLAVYRARRSASGVVRSFKLSVAAQSLDLTWDGVPVDYADPPRVQLAVAGHVYVSEYPDAGGPGGGPTGPAIPDGNVVFTRAYRGTAMLPPGTAALADVRIRSAAELSGYLAQFQVAPSIGAVDFADSELAVVAGQPFDSPLWPWAVEVTGAAAASGTVEISYLAYFGPMFGPEARLPGPPPRSVFVEAIRIPRGAGSVLFRRTAEERADPWH